MQTHVADLELDAVLVLSDGDFFLGKGIGAKGRAGGEICFNTGLTGYQETLTDPSYAEQLITFTFPHIGNVGTNPEDDEASKPYCKGLIVREEITSPSSFRTQQHLDGWLKKHQLVGISGVDTRELTRNIREKGGRYGLIYHANPGEVLDVEALVESIRNQPSLLGCEVASRVSTKKAYSWDEHSFRLGQSAFAKQSRVEHTIVAFDFGIKHNILRLLVDEGFRVHVLPCTASFEDIMALNPDGVFLSNGPGDPFETAKITSPVLQKLLSEQISIFGICMGHQLLALAAGIATNKMHKGHRGTNQPVQHVQSKRVFITSQNHGFCVSDDVPENVEITYRSLFDGSVEGLRFKDAPAFSVQFHPESSPGPHETRFLFQEFKTLIKTSKRNLSYAKT